MKRTLVALAAAALMTLPSVGLGNVQAAHPRAGGTTITVWEDFSKDQEAQFMTLAAKWATANGDKVNWVNNSQPGMGGGSTSVADLLRLKAKSASAADLVYSTEDQAGNLVASGILAPRPASLLSAADLAKYQPSALGASSVNGVAYSVPQAVDGTFLFYNKSLVPTAPTNWTDLIATAKKLNQGNRRYGLLYNITGGLYYNYWAFSGYGAYVFGTKNGKFDTTDIGMDNAGAVQALTFLKSLTTIMPKTTDYNAADSNFSAGKAAMTINGPWQMAAYQKALGNNLGAAPIPNLPNGKTAHTFIGVRVWEVNNFSKNQAVAWDLAKYMSMNGQAISGTYEGRLPAFKTVAGWTPNPIQDAASKAFSVGVPMPNIPEFNNNTAWNPLQSAITLAIQGRASPAVALSTAVQQMKAALAKEAAGS
jgi:arabinogalactan oligomer/maltooligosaccharide transport system substrate-binding protein